MISCKKVLFICATVLFFMSGTCRNEDRRRELRSLTRKARMSSLSQTDCCFALSWLIIPLSVILQAYVTLPNRFVFDTFESNEVIAVCSAILSLMFLILFALSRFKGAMRYYVTLAILLRFIVMLWNVYGRDIFTLVGVGSDSEGFYWMGDMISKNLGIIFQDERIYGTVYSVYLGLLYFLIGSSYFFSSYINFLCACTSIFLLDTILQSAQVLEKRRNICTFVYAFMPNFIITGSSMRRESMIILSVLLSFYAVKRWYDTGKFGFFFLSLIILLAGCALHAGIVGTLAGYAYLLATKSRMPASAGKRCFMLAIFALGVALALIFFPGVFLDKLLTDPYSQMAHSGGGAAYLTGLQIQGPIDVILYLPIKIFYFLFAPVPWKWRGIADCVAFALDSSVFLWLSKDLIYSASHFKKSSPLRNAALIASLCCIVIFAVGSGNAATAMRHRMKLLGLLLLLHGLSGVPARLPAYLSDYRSVKLVHAQYEKALKL